MTTGMSVPLELAGMLCAGFALLGIWAGRVLSRRALRGGTRPLRAMMTPDAMAQAIDLAAHRSASRDASQAVLRGRIDPASLNSDNRKQMRDHVAAVMRAGLRRDDRVTLAEGDGFTIILPGTDERSAVRIADRLRRRLARMPWTNLSAGPGLNARFGVAAGRHGQPVDNIAARARRALDAAWDHGNDHVVPASAIEEILLLPPPPAAAAAA
ncbi:diguanylate cyclase [Porphyrobacter sp. YT40]|uniref:diguanylate cyclase domain-containing protein n=1 Tax=Porphyrobacter sp. YT40 TaxID=2547601 RepID=UPI001143D715|nr:diguanylate cyclase [Porphyrobacter sp. YT40]QDH35376.1 diguanylate cyclase [Porphyrobacter sp. YT40]